MTDIDYSRPVGWWCAYCEEDGPCFREQTCISMGCKKIPVYLPIPEGQRPLVEDEVESAEVVTAYSSPSPSTPFTVVRSARGGVLRVDTVLEGMDLAATIQRIVTGATE